MVIIFSQIAFDSLGKRGDGRSVGILICFSVSHTKQEVLTITSSSQLLLERNLENSRMNSPEVRVRSGQKICTKIVLHGVANF